MRSFTVGERGISRTFGQIVNAHLCSIIALAQRKLTGDNQNYMCILFSHSGKFCVFFMYNGSVG